VASSTRERPAKRGCGAARIDLFGPARSPREAVGARMRVVEGDEAQALCERRGAPRLDDAGGRAGAGRLRARPSQFRHPAFSRRAKRGSSMTRSTPWRSRRTTSAYRRNRRGAIDPDEPGAAGGRFSRGSPFGVNEGAGKKQLGEPAPLLARRRPNGRFQGFGSPPRSPSMSSRPRREALARILPATGRGRPESAIAQRDALVCRIQPPTGRKS